MLVLKGSFLEVRSSHLPATKVRYRWSKVCTPQMGLTIFPETIWNQRSRVDSWWAKMQTGGLWQVDLLVLLRICASCLGDSPFISINHIGRVIFQIEKQFIQPYHTHPYLTTNSKGFYRVQFCASTAVREDNLMAAGLQRRVGLSLAAGRESRCLIQEEWITLWWFNTLRSFFHSFRDGRSPIVSETIFNKGLV